MYQLYWARLPEHNDILTQGYVGVTADLGSRKAAHHWEAHHEANQSRYKYHFKSAIRKHGDRIKWDVMVIGEPDYILDLENKLRPKPKIGWNMAIGGAVSPMLGRELSPEVKAKLSEVRRGERNGMFGRKHSESAKLRVSQANSGRKLTDEQKAKISAACRNPSPEARAKMSAANSGRNNCMYGKRHSPESIAKMSEAHKRLQKPAWVNAINRLASSKAYWLRADEYYAEWSKETAMGGRRLAKAFAEDVVGPHHAIVKKFRAGWVPIEDQKWVEFKQQENANG